MLIVAKLYSDLFFKSIFKLLQRNPVLPMLEVAQACVENVQVREECREED